jgi:CHAD domain-containing protein
MATEPQAARFALRGGAGARSVLTLLRSRFRVHSAPLERSRLRYLDTFDWRIQSRGWSLSSSGGEYRLAEARGGRQVDACNGVGDERFWWDFPEGTFRDRLRECLDERALLPLFEADISRRPAAVVNADDKTVVRFRVEDVTVYNDGQRAGSLESLVVERVRGYDREFEEVRETLLRSGLRTTEAAFVDAALELVGRVPGDYSSKLNVALEGSMSAREAAGVIFRHLLATMRRNEPGILADIDTEFVHDFRVAIRRTRSGLTQLKRVLPDEVTSRFRADFARVGRLTNRLRDLDVYLLQRDRYRSMLPPALRGGLDPVFSAMESERTGELEQVRTALEGDDYRRVVSDWKETLERLSDLPASAPADTPITALARRLIHQRYRRVLRAGAAVTDESPDDDLHALRIHCKKLRYQLEFFSSLFPRDLDDMVKQLKKLQDNLGAFNDYSVQQQELYSHLEDGPPKREVAAAIGALVACLHREQLRTRNEFEERFTYFAARENQELFERLFGSGAQ